jgi:uncharacterized protein
MRDRMLSTTPSGRSYALVFDLDDDVLTDFQQFCERENIYAAFFYGIGGYRTATLAYYDMGKKRYEPIDVDEQVEVVSFIGNVTNFEGKPRIHAHCVVGHRDGHTTAGHLLQGVVSPTLEVMLQDGNVPMQRTQRPEIGIPLIDL